MVLHSRWLRMSVYVALMLLVYMLPLGLVFNLIFLLCVVMDYVCWYIVFDGMVVADTYLMAQRRARDKRDQHTTDDQG